MSVDTNTPAGTRIRYAGVGAGTPEYPTTATVVEAPSDAPHDLVFVEDDAEDFALEEAIFGPRPLADPTHWELIEAPVTA